MRKGALPPVYLVPNGAAWQRIDGAVIEETEVCIYVDGQEIVSLRCSPVDLESLALGFLYTEGLIHGLDDVEMVELSHRGTCVDVWLHNSITLPRRIIRTSGCGGGVTFDDLAGQRAPMPVQAVTAAQQVIDRYFDLRAAETLYPLARGVHASALCTPDRLLLFAEDVGRHNTLDKLAGMALQLGLDTRDCLIVTTGRISSEMLGKAAKLGVSLVASRTSPTSRSLALAQAWNITVVGYIRRDSLRLYTIPERILTAAVPVPEAT